MQDGSTSQKFPIQTYMLFTARELCIGKNCTDLWPYSRPLAQFFPVQIGLSLQIKFFIIVKGPEMYKILVKIIKLTFAVIPQLFNTKFVSSSGWCYQPLGPLRSGWLKFPPWRENGGNVSSVGPSSEGMTKYA